MAHKPKSVRERARRKRGNKLTLPFRAVLAFALVWIWVLVGSAGDAFSGGLVFDPVGALSKIWIKGLAPISTLVWD